jgi:broad specificity phosphatase PhoE
MLPDLCPQFDPDLREIDFGQWEDLTYCDALRDNPAAVARWVAYDPDFAFPGGESLKQFQGRVQAVAERLTQAAAQTVLAVTHGGVARVMICHLLGLPTRRYVAFDVPYAGSAVIDLFDGRGVLAALERPENMEPPENMERPDNPEPPGDAENGRG